MWEKYNIKSINSITNPFLKFKIIEGNLLREDFVNLYLIIDQNSIIQSKILETYLPIKEVNLVWIIGKEKIEYTPSSLS